MILPEILWTIAYGIFVAGAAWSYRSDGSWGAIGCMGVGVLLDASVSFLPALGVDALSYHMTRSNAVVLASIALGLVAYAFFLGGVWLRWRGRRKAFHFAVATTQVVWFLSFIGFLYGLYIIPGAAMR
jgi:hypothetical protein